MKGQLWGEGGHCRLLLQGLWGGGCRRPWLCPSDSPVLGSQFKRRVQESTQVLRELEISLRTNHIG